MRDRIQNAQAALLSSGSNFTLSAPFDGIDHARAEADAAPHRLLLAGGGALAAFALFIVLAAGALRADQRADSERLRMAGARNGQCALFVIAESAWLCGVAVIAGACVAVVAAVVLAHAAGVPAGGVLTHSLLTPAGLVGVLAGWVAATALLSLALVGAGARAADLAAVAAAAALTIAMIIPTGSGDQLPVLLAPLACVVAGVVIYRLVASALRGGERVARRGPVLARLAFVGLARAPASPSLAIAFVAVSVGLGGFALAYRATLLRGTADQAANVVPLDATVSPAADFATPLQLASLARWRSLSRGQVLPVRDTEATYASGGGTVTVPALGVPAAGLPLIHGWRSGDGSAPLGTLASRLAPRGPTRTPGPRVVPGARSLSVRAVSPGLGVAVTADLRAPSGSVTHVPLGSASGRSSELDAPDASGRLGAAGARTRRADRARGHHRPPERRGSSAPTQTVTTVGLGPVRFLSADGRPVGNAKLGGWRGVGAAVARPRPGSAAADVRFTESGQPGILRPVAPSDTHPVAVLVDGHTASAAATGGRLALTVDGQSVNARVVGVLRRFPTVPASAAGFLVADEATLAGALDAQMPGQGAADDLWISSGDLAPLRAALRAAPLSRLNRSFRADIEHRLRVAPIARGVLGTLLAAAALAIALAVVGLLVTLLGATRDERVQRDLMVQGVGPRGLRRELRLRLLLAGVLGTRGRVGSGGAADAAGGGERPRRRHGRGSAAGVGDGCPLGPAGGLGAGGDRGPRGDELGGLAVTDPAATTEPVVKLREVFCVHRTNEGDAAALQGTNLDLGEGELLCVLGPSGAGKSTLLRVIAGIQEPSAGVVQVLGRDIGREPGRRRASLRHERIGFLGQHADSALPPDLTARRAVELPLALRGRAPEIRRERVSELLHAAGLADRAEALPAELSGGERQRVALCAALAHRPSLLLADEPTGELDDESAEAVRRLIADLARRHGTSVVLVSHDAATAEIADRSVRIRDGRVVEDRRNGESALVVGRGGWLRLPAELLEQAGIGERARAEVLNGGVMLTGVGGAAAPARADAGGPPADAATPSDHWSPTRVAAPRSRPRSRPRGRAPGRARRAQRELRGGADDGRQRPLGRRQDDAAADDRRPRQGRRRRAADRRCRAGRVRRRAASGAAARADRLPPPGAHARGIPQRRGERGPGAAAARLRPGRGGRARGGRAEPRGAGRPSAPARVPAVGGRGPAGRAGPGAGQRPRAADRR